MLEYSCEETSSLLHKNLENAKATLGVLVGDQQFLRDQVTVTKVMVARVYIWDVHHRREQAAVGASSSVKDSSKDCSLSQKIVEYAVWHVLLSFLGYPNSKSCGL